MLVELAAIYGEAARDVPSHFTTGSALDAVVIQRMGVGIAVDVAAVAARLDDLPAPFVWACASASSSPPPSRGPWPARSPVARWSESPPRQ